MRNFLEKSALIRILSRKINRTAAKSALIETALREYSLYLFVMDSFNNICNEFQTEEESKEELKDESPKEESKEIEIKETPPEEAKEPEAAAAQATSVSEEINENEKKEDDEEEVYDNPLLIDVNRD